MPETKLHDMTISQEIFDKYAIKDNTFTVFGDNPKDLIVAEVGDSKQPDTFRQQVKVSRWNNEVNMSIRLLNDDLDAPVISTVGEKIIYDKQKYTASFYELAPSQELEGGGYEFEITLKEKPASNILNFSIKTKGLKFYYQPELTAEEIALRYSRPDNVVGSYVIYYDNCPLNIKGGKEYKCGKMGQIPRPKITDSLGATEWGDININPIAETLTVTIPQDFLDSATYPINHAAGLTFGYTSVGASSGGTVKDFIFAHPRYTPASSGEVDSISVYATSVTGGAKMTVGLYLSPTTVATDLVAEASEISLTTNTWNTSTFAQEAISNGTYYRIGIQVGVQTSALKYDSTGGHTDYYQSRSYTASSMPDPFVSASLESPGQWSSYTTYTAGPTPYVGTAHGFVG